MTSPEQPKHPRDMFITVFGRKPVLEALRDEQLQVDKVLLARNARGAMVDEIKAAAKARKVPCKQVDAAQVTRISKNGRQDQGAVADIHAPNLVDARDFLDAHGDDRPLQLLAVDGVTTPANVGLMIRSAAAAGMDGVILPRKGVAGLSPLVVKASAGVLFKIPLLRCERIDEALGAATDHGVEIVALDGEGQASLLEVPLPRRGVYVLGNEATGVGEVALRLARQHVYIPMATGVESINVACASTLVCFEALRRAPRV